MKRILIIKDSNACWTTVEYLFREVNAEIVSLDGDTDMDLAGAAQPDLVMISGANLSRLPPALRKKPRIVFVTENTSGGEQPLPPRENDQQLLWWPRDRARLREIASVVLGISPRKKFKTLIRVFRGEDKQGFIGSSIDFSLTGMAFSAESTVVYGSQVDISLSLPRDNESLRFSLNVLRCTDEELGGVRHYGGEYVNMPKDTLKRITSFLYDG